MGFAHVGVLQVLGERGFRPDAVAGTSIGAVIGAAYAFGKMDALERTVARLGRLEMLRLADVGFGKGGLLAGGAVSRLLRAHLGDARVEDAPLPFVAVAVDLARDEEVWLNRGPLVEAIRASISVPGLFAPVRRGERLLVDGGLKNPVPVSACRAMGATAVVAVDVIAPATPPPGRAVFAPVPEAPPASGLADRFGEGLRLAGPGGNVARVLVQSFGTMTKELASARARLDPPDVAIAPRTGFAKPMDFHRGPELVEAGRAAAESAWPAIEALRRGEDL